MQNSGDEKDLHAVKTKSGDTGRSSPMDTSCFQDWSHSKHLQPAVHQSFLTRGGWGEGDFLLVDFLLFLPHLTSKGEYFWKCVW